MTKKFKNMQLQTLDQHLKNVRVYDRPSEGWIHAIRAALGMSVRQLAERMGMKQQSASRLETNEADDSITLKSLRKAAEAMDCKLVYAIVPHDGTLQNIVKKQALKKAKALVKPVDHTMQLESQGVGNTQGKIQQVADELAQNINTKLWD